MADGIALSDALLERLLLDVGAHLDDPQPVALAVRVRARIEEREATRARTRWRRLAIAGAAVVTVAATLVLVPGTRDAVAHWLGLHGLHIEDRADLPLEELGGNLALGDATTLADARARADFRVLQPRGFGPPDEVYVARVAGAVVVTTLLYDAGDELTPASASGVGLLLTEFRAGLSDPLLSKVIDSGVQLDEVRVDSGRGYWFEGEPHVLSFVDPEGRDIEEASRLAGNTLVWERGPLTVRLESGLSRADAIRVAESLTP
ncbi:MAG: hypothetical protein L0206_01300 [Actinobacteria bacterium]|nr:hypothetical protein [Actinomycetota bacterium]